MSTAEFLTAERLENVSLDEFDRQCAGRLHDLVCRFVEGQLPVATLYAEAAALGYSRDRVKEVVNRARRRYSASQWLTEAERLRGAKLAARAAVAEAHEQLDKKQIELQAKWEAFQLAVDLPGKQAAAAEVTKRISKLTADARRELSNTAPDTTDRDRLAGEAAEAEAAAEQCRNIHRRHEQLEALEKVRDASFEPLADRLGRLRFQLERLSTADTPLEIPQKLRRELDAAEREAAAIEAARADEQRHMARARQCWAELDALNAKMNDWRTFSVD